MKKLLSLLILITFPLLVSAQVFRVGQLIPITQNITGVVYATSTSAGSFLSATTSPTIASLTATSTTLKSIFPNASTTNLSANVFCLTSDICRTTWPSGFNANAKWATSTNLNSIYPNGGNNIAVTIGESATSTSGTLLEVLGNIFTSGSTTLQAFTGTNSTTTGATSTSLYTSAILQAGMDTSTGGLRIGSSGIVKITTSAAAATDVTLTAGSASCQMSQGINGWSCSNSYAPNLVSGTSGTADLVFKNIVSSSATEGMRLTATTENLGIGTTTPNWRLQVAGTAPSIALSDTNGGTNLKHWIISNIGGALYVGTTTDGYATSSPSAITVLNNGKIGISTSSPSATLGIAGNIYTKSTATSTFDGNGLNLTAGCFAVNNTCVGGASASTAPTASTTRMGVSVAISSTTNVTANSSYIVFVTGDTSQTPSGLYMKQASNATTTLANVVSLASAPTSVTWIASWTATVTEQVQIYAATSPSATPIPANNGFNFTLLRLNGN